MLETAQLSVFEKETGSMQADTRLVCLRVGRRQTVSRWGQSAFYLIMKLLSEDEYDVELPGLYHGTGHAA